MKSVAVAILAVAVLDGSALAAIPSTTDYKLATEPLVTGKVASVNDQTLVMDTDQGSQVSLEMDSRTMVPTDLAPGMQAWVEFKLEKNGNYYAKRVIPMREGMNRNRELAYSTLHDQGAPLATNATSGSDATSGTGASGAGAAAGAGAAVGSGASSEADASTTAANSSSDTGKHESLPQTASNQPLLLLLGTLALAAAGVLAVSRRLRRA
jgi:LPXTG-motif cell wall-anchored protein